LGHARLAAVLLLGLAGLPARSASAQPASQGLVVRDGTLGGSPAGPVGGDFDPTGRWADYLIRADLGEQDGGNLFHSFARFGIGQGETATFTDQGAPDPGGIEHVISRVTGGEASQIDGTLRSTIDGADLWLFNPQGVGFGAGARIDVPGTFHAGSADSVEFEDGGEPFRTEATPPAVLATARPSAFGFLPDGGRAALVVTGGLAVTRGEALLAGGDVTLTGAGLEAPGAELGFEATGDVQLTDHSVVDVGGEAPGSISIRGGRIEVVGDSQVLAENHYVAPRTGALRRGPLAHAPGPGAITVEAGESVLVDRGLLSVNTSGTGNAGTIRISGLAGGARPDVRFEHGEGLHDWTPVEADSGARAETTSRGAAGRISIDARSLVLRDGVAVSAGAVGAKPTPVARGAAGAIEIRADSVEVSDRSFIAVGGWGSTGKAGTITIDLGGSGALVADGYTPPTGDPHRYALILAGNGGSPGSLEIRGGSIWVRNGGSITASTDDSTGPGGRIDIVDAPSIVIETGGQIRAGTTTAGDAGTIDIVGAGSVKVDSGGAISADTSASGNAGTITIDADSLELRDGGQIVARGATGNGGRIVVDAETVQIGPGRPPGKPGPGVFVTAFGAGNAGSVQITASKWIDLTDEGAPRFDLSPVLSFPPQPLLLTGIVSGTVGGAGGPITLDAPLITVRDGALISSSSVGGKGGGDIVLRGDRIRIASGGMVSGTSFFTPAEASALILDALESIKVFGHSVFGDPSQVTSATLSEGQAGSVRLMAPRIVVDEGAVATVAVPLEGRKSGAAGEIRLDASADGGQVIVRNGGQVTASTMGSGNGGTIEIRAGESIVVEGTESSIASRTGADGAGGNIALGAPRIEVSMGGGISAESRAGLDELGPIVDFFRGKLGKAPPKATGNAGSVTLEASHLVHLDGGFITTSVGSAAGGNIAIDPVFVILENGSRILATADDGGTGGAIRIATENFFAFPGSEVSADSSIQELSGTVEIHSPDVNLAGSLAELPSTVLDASAQMRPRCAARKSGERVGSFALRGPGGIPAEPDGWLPAPLLPDVGAALADQARAQPLVVANFAGPLISRGACP